METDKKVVSLIIAPERDSDGNLTKYLLDFEGDGNPLIYNSIYESKRSNAEVTYVFTDSSDLYIESLEYGADHVLNMGEERKFFTEPDENGVLNTKSYENIIYNFSDTVSVDFDVLVVINPSFPFVNREYINKSIDMVLSDEYDFVFCGKQEINDNYSQNIEGSMLLVLNKYSLVENSIRFSYSKVGFVEVSSKDSLVIINGG